MQNSARPAPSSLFDAVRAGDAALANSLLEQGADPCCADAQDRCLPLLAMQTGNPGLYLPILKAAIARNAWLRGHVMDCCKHAAETGDPAAARLLAPLAKAWPEDCAWLALCASAASCQECFEIFWAWADPRSLGKARDAMRAGERDARVPAFCIRSHLAAPLACLEKLAPFLAGAPETPQALWNFAAEGDPGEFLQAARVLLAAARPEDQLIARALACDPGRRRAFWGLPETGSDSGCARAAALLQSLQLESACLPNPGAGAAARKARSV